MRFLPKWSPQFSFTKLQTFDDNNQEDGAGDNEDRDGFDGSSKSLGNSSTPWINHSIIFYILLFTNLILLSLLVLSVMKDQYTPGNIFRSSFSQPLVRTYIASNESYQSTHHTHDDLWEDLMGTTGGILKFTDMDHPVGIAMFHQLHCLVQIRTFMQHAQEGKDIGWDMASNHRLADENMHGHWAHCFDYLRQVILCQADDSLQKYDALLDFGAGDISAESIRMCRNPQQLYNLTSCGKHGCAKDGKLPKKADLRGLLTS